MMTLAVENTFGLLGWEQRRLSRGKQYPLKRFDLHNIISCVSVGCDGNKRQKKGSH